MNLNSFFFCTETYNPSTLRTLLVIICPAQHLQTTSSAFEKSLNKSNIAFLKFVFCSIFPLKKGSLVSFIHIKVDYFLIRRPSCQMWDISKRVRNKLLVRKCVFSFSIRILLDSVFIWKAFKITIIIVLSDELMRWMTQYNKQTEYNYLK